MGFFSRVRLVEEDYWDFDLPADLIIRSIAAVTGTPMVPYKEERPALYFGEINSSEFRIREVGPGASTVAGQGNATIIRGQVKTLGQGSQMHVRASQFNVRLLFIGLGPFLVLAAFLQMIPEETWLLPAGIAAIVVLVLLMIGGINDEIKESMTTLKDRIKKLEESHRSNG